MIEPLEKERIIASISQKNREKIAFLEIFECIDSTNSYLLTRAKNGALSGSVCLAEQQTQGRGRRGRSWDSPLGANIYCSLLWRFAHVVADKSSLSLAIAVMVLNTLKKYGVEKQIQLKWPNDVLIDGRKIAGILLESTDQKSVVIGVGLNVLSAPENGNAISLAEIIDRIPVRNVVTGLLLNELVSQLETFEEKGLRTFLHDWRQHDVLFGKEITVQLPDKTFAGVMRGVDEHGNLLLEEFDGKTQKFCYGEVSVRLAL